jgi:hypothetical protein
MAIWYIYPVWVYFSRFGLILPFWFIFPVLGFFSSFCYIFPFCDNCPVMESCSKKNQATNTVSRNALIASGPDASRACMHAWTKKKEFFSVSECKKIEQDDTHSEVKRKSRTMEVYDTT